MLRHSTATLVSLIIFSSALGQESPKQLLQEARKVLAKLDGKMAVPGLKQPVEILRDRWGIAHIYAKNSDDLFRAQGFVAAQDRLFQIDMWRRVAVGEVSEVVGPKALPIDRMSRLLKYRGDMEAEWTSYSPDTRRIATAFTSGINAYIDHIGDKLPIEFKLLGIKPKKWQPEDILGRMSGIIMTRNFRNEIPRAELIAAVGVDKARRFWPTDPVKAYQPDIDPAGITRDILKEYYQSIAAIPFPRGPGGSNNWVIDGTISASGKPMLASDPHRTINNPSLRYLVHLNAPGWNVIGSGEPGLPGVAIGHNDHVAWGFTIVGTDQADVFVEETNPANPNQYKVGDRWADMKVIKEKLNIRGSKPVELALRFTRHGAVIHQDEERRRAYALKWVGSEPGTAAYLGSLAVDRAMSVKGFIESTKAWKTPSENLVIADTDGNIGWIAAALSPVRKGYDGLLPVPGATNKYQWDGFLPVKELPQIVNPSSHYILTANHNILPDGYKHPISWEWAAPFRNTRLEERFRAQKKFTLEDFKSMQHDNISIPGRILGGLLKELRVDDPELKPYVQLLAGWNGNLDRDSQAGPLYGIWLRELHRAFYQPLVPKRVLDIVAGKNNVEVMLKALQKPTSFWFGKKPLAARDRLLRTTLAAAVRETQKRLGDDMNKWQWGRLHTTPFPHPLARIHPAYAKAFSLGPVPRAGDGYTPNAASHNNRFEQLSGGSYRHVFDLSDWDKGMVTSSPGQSGQPGSPHYDDLLPLWAKDKYFPLAFSRKKVESVTQNRLVLKPAGGK